MHLSPIKGGFPHKDQHDRTALVKVGSAIERGSVIRINGETGEFEVAEDASTYPMYLALQNYNDLQATMAGLYTPANGDPEIGVENKNKFPYKPGAWKRDETSKHKSNLVGREGATQPAITGIHMDDGDVWETDMYDESADWENAGYNAKLTVVDGLITLANDSNDAEGIVGFLVKAPYQRYANDAVAVTNMMTGRSIWVIQFQCGK